MSRHLLRPLAGSLLLTLLVVTAARAQRSDMLSLQPGDEVRVTVWRYPELSGDFRVAPDSTVAHPLYKQIKVVGVPIEQLENQFLDVLRTLQQDPLVVVQPLMRVAVGGEVQRPSVIALPAGSTLGQAVFEAGGPTPDGRLNNVKLIRRGQERKIDLTGPSAGAADLPLFSGDQVLVGRRGVSVLEVVGPIASLASLVTSIIAITQE